MEDSSAGSSSSGAAPAAAAAGAIVVIAVTVAAAVVYRRRRKRSAAVVRGRASKPQLPPDSPAFVSPLAAAVVRQKLAAVEPPTEASAAAAPGAAPLADAELARSVSDVRASFVPGRTREVDSAAGSGGVDIGVGESRLRHVASASGLRISPALQSALSRASQRSLALAATTPASQARAPIVVGGVKVHAQASKPGEENAKVGLPAGWSAVWSQSKQLWYWRADNGEVSWTKPVAPALPPPPAGDADATAAAAAAAEAEASANQALLPGYVAVWSKSRLAWYWRHTESGVSTWTKPTEPTPPPA